MQAITNIIVCKNPGALSSIPFGSQQLIFIPDRNRIAIDWNGKRTFYNQIEILNSEYERLAIKPKNGVFYFVLARKVLWLYQKEWIQVTGSTDSVFYIGEGLPELGNEDMLYVDKKAKNISVWEEGSSEYVQVADLTKPISENIINDLFE